VYPPELSRAKCRPRPGKQVGCAGCGFVALPSPHKWEFYAEGVRSQARRQAGERHVHQASG